MQTNVKFSALELLSLSYHQLSLIASPSGCMTKRDGARTSAMPPDTLRDDESWNLWGTSLLGPRKAPANGSDHATF